MNILQVTNMYPTHDRPYFGIFVRIQIDSLKKLGVSSRIICIGKNFGGYRNVFGIKEDVQWADLVHCHFGHTASFSLFWKYLSKKPLVVSYCGDDLLGKATGSGKYRWFTNLPSLVNAHLSRFVDCAIVKSRQLAQRVRCRRIEIIPNGVDLSLFREIPRDEARKKIGLEGYKGKIILFLGQRKNPVKNYPLFLNALKHLNFKFKVLALENIPYEDVVYYLNASDVCVLTSVHEGSSNAIKEAMACNRPIVSVDVGDVKELLSGVKGCFVVSHNSREIAEAVKRVIEAGKSNTRRRIVEKGLSLEAVAQRISEVYTSLIG